MNCQPTKCKNWISIGFFCRHKLGKEIFLIFPILLERRKLKLDNRCTCSKAANRSVIKGVSWRCSVKYSFGRGLPKTSYARPVLTKASPQ